jgi:hypothetical protein
MSRRPNVTIQVLPFPEGGHPGTLGSVILLEFPEEVHSPVAYVETYAGDVYLEKEDDLVVLSEGVVGAEDTHLRPDRDMDR